MASSLSNSLKYFICSLLTLSREVICSDMTKKFSDSAANIFPGVLSAAVSISVSFLFKILPT